MPNDTQLRDAVARLVRQVELNTGTNTEGHSLGNNNAFLDVKKLMEK